MFSQYDDYLKRSLLNQQMGMQNMNQDYWNAIYGMSMHSRVPVAKEQPPKPTDSINPKLLLLEEI